MTPRRSALLTAIATLALAVGLLTTVSWLAGAGPADASAASPSVSPPHGTAAAFASMPHDATSESALLPSDLASGAQQQPDADDSTSDTSQPEEPASHDIVVRPDTEARPQQPEDRGGALQITVLLIVVAGLGTIAALAVREARRRQRAGTAGRAASP